MLRAADDSGRGRPFHSLDALNARQLLTGPNLAMQPDNTNKLFNSANLPIMNIDYLANLIESADVPTFRTLATLFLRSMGYTKGFYSDGPYDGGVDFFVFEESGTGIKTAFQLSIEKGWKRKLEAEVKKAKANYPSITAFIFVSNRRIPLHSIQKLNSSLIQKHGLAATHYDNQAIATEFIHKDLVTKLYETLNIKLPSTIERTHITPKTEAASALLLFGTDSGDFRSEMTENLIIAELEKSGPATEADFATVFMQTHSFDILQKPEIIRAIRRAIQSGKIVSKASGLTISEAMRTRHAGLKSLAAGEFEALRRSVENYLDKTAIGKAPNVSALLLDNLLALSVALWRRFSPHSSMQVNSAVDETFQSIHSTLSACLGASEAPKAIAALAELVAKSDFAKKIAAAELFYSLIQSNSSQLIAALGGNKGLYVLFDTQVLIPLLCGLLFDRVEDHKAYSARLLIDLLEKHRFTALAPNKYIEEAAGHLVRCCREYQAVLNSGEDLSFSANAFASHFSQLRKLDPAKALSFDEYISVFGSPAGSRYVDLSDEFYYPTIEKIGNRMSELLQRYGVGLLGLDNRRYDSLFTRISNLVGSTGQSRGSILIEHDARVVGYLESPEIPTGWAKVLCTWDSIQLRLNPNWDSYCVMNPASVTDLLSIIKSEEDRAPMSQLIDFVWMQSEESTKLSSQVWDEIVAVEKGKLADGILLSKARAFRQNYIEKHKTATELDLAQVGSLWLKWKRSDN